MKQSDESVPFQVMALVGSDSALILAIRRKYCVGRMA